MSAKAKGVRSRKGHTLNSCIIEMLLFIADGPQFFGVSEFVVRLGLDSISNLMAAFTAFH